MNKEDQDRLVKLRLKVFGEVARKLIANEKGPYWLPKEEIESHGGRIGKALRLLWENGYLGSSRTFKEKDRYNTEVITTVYEILKFDEESAQYACSNIIEAFIQKMPDLYRDTFDLQPESAGFQEVSRLQYVDAIYIWHHKEEMRRNTYDDSQEVYPLVIERQRDINVMRCFVEQYLACSYRTRFQKIISFNGELPRKHIKDIKHRNIGYSPTLLSEECFKDYEGEYLHWERYFRAYKQNLQVLRESLSTLGGPENVIKQMRLECIAELLHKAPLDIQKKNILKIRAKYILQHRDLLDYDTIYGQDASVTHIDNEGFDEDGEPNADSVNEFVQEPFEVDPEDAAIAAQAKE